MLKLNNKQLVDINGGNFLVVADPGATSLPQEPVDGFATHKEAAAAVASTSDPKLLDIIHIKV